MIKNESFNKKRKISEDFNHLQGQKFFFVSIFWCSRVAIDQLYELLTFSLTRRN